MRFSCDDYGVEEMPAFIGEKISLEKMKVLQKQIPDAELEFPYNIDTLVSYYPNVVEVSYIDEGGNISNERLDLIVSERYVCKNDEIEALIRALGGMKHERLLEIADYFLMRCSYLSLIRLHDMQTVRAIVEELMKMPRSVELEEYLLDIMIQYEDEYPAIGEMIIEYL